MAIQKVRLPFDLPCNLRVTQYKGDSRTHKTGNAIDLEPLVESRDYPGQIAEYLTTYIELFSHLRYGLLRINKSKTCWHYHLYADPKQYASGFEQYAKGTKIINGRPVSACVEFGAPYEISHKKNGAAVKLSAMIEEVGNYLIDSNFFTSIFSIDNYRLLYEKLAIKNKPAFVLYDTAIISRVDLLQVLECFDFDYTLTAAQMLSDDTPADRQISKYLLYGAAAFAAFTVLSNRKRD